MNLPPLERAHANTLEWKGLRMYRLQCFGGAAIKAPDGSEVHLRSQKHLALFLYLVAHPHRSFRRYDLACLLWDTEEKLARHSLSQALYDIRKRLRPVRFRARSGTISLSENEIRYDGATLEDAIKAGDLASVPGLYRGGFASNLEGVGTSEFEVWLESERTRYAMVAQMALRRYVEDCDMQGRWGEMCLTALRLVKLNPLDEAAHRALMRALWLHGDQQSALRHFGEVEEFLVRELPDGISDETLDLVRRIRSSRPIVRRVSEKEGQPALVGRAKEFERLRFALSEVVGGRGCIMLVRGEAGIGKTRLLQELATLAAIKGVDQLWSRCYAAESDLAYGPIMDGVQPIAERLARMDCDEEHQQQYYQLGRLFPELFYTSGPEEFPGIDPDVRKRRLYEEVVDLLRRACKPKPLLWIVEDVQWIDASSASLLHYISRRLAKRACLIVMSVRSDEKPSSGARLLLAADGTRAPPATIELGALEAFHVRQLVKQAAEPVEAHAVSLAERYSGGNPFFALEITRTVGSSQRPITSDVIQHCLSDGLRNLLAARLRAIPPEGIRILEGTAVLERHASPENIAAVTGLRLMRTAEAASDLCSRRLLVEEHNRYEFSHELMKAFVYSTVGPIRRSAMHLAAGEVLSTKTRPNPATLARHYRLAGDHARAYEYATRAASLSMESFAYDEAVQMADLALSSSKTSGQRYEALSIRAKAQFLAGDCRGAEASYTDLTTFDGYPQHFDNLYALVEVRITLSEWQRAWHAANQLETALKRGLHMETTEEANLRRLVVTGKLALLSRDFDRARTIHNDIGTIIEAHNASNPLPAALHATALANQLVYTSMFVSVYEAGRLLADAHIDISQLPYSGQQRLLLAQSFVLLRSAKWDSGRAVLLDALDRAENVNDVLGQANALTNLAVPAIETGNWKEGEQRTQEALQIYRKHQLDATYGLETNLNLANLLFYTGRLRSADVIYRDLIRVAEANADTRLCAELLAARGLIALQRSDRQGVTTIKGQLNGCVKVRQLGNQEPFKIDWFLAFATPEVSTMDRLAYLEAAAEEFRKKDPVSYLKLRALRYAVGQGEDAQEPVAEERPPWRVELSASEMTWFIPFCRRWVGAVRRSWGFHDM